MEKLKIALLGLVAVLLLIQIIDRNREPEQMGELKKSLDRLSAELARGVTVTGPATGSADPGPGTGSRPANGSTTGAHTWPAAVPPRDGNPTIGVNFLLPYDRSWYDPTKVGGTLRSINSSPKSLNPLTDQSATSSDVHGLCSDSLCSRPPYAPEQWREELATSCVIEEDYTVYRFTIRDGIIWQRPTFAGSPGFEWLAADVPLTASDFAFTLDLIMDPAVDCPSIRNYYEDLESWQAIDDRTFEMRWKRKVYNSLSMSMGLQPTPRHVYGRNADGSEIAKDRLGATFNKHWFDERRAVIGVGAYILESFEPEQQMIFVRNPRYWGVADHFERREWKLNIKDPEAELTAFKNGQIQAFGLSPLKYKSEILDGKEKRFAPLDPKDPKAGRKGPFGWERFKAMSFTYLGWNMRRKPFDDRRVRQAMSHCFPKDRIIRDIYFGLGQPVLSDVHPDSQYYDHELKPYAFDPKKARALLAEAGWTDSDGDSLLDREIDGKRETFSFEIKYFANSPEWDNTLGIYRQELRKVGIDMTPKPYEWAELVRIYEDKDFHAVVGGWRMSWDIDYFQLWHSTQIEAQGSSNFCGFANARVDELADKLRTTFETDERIAIVKEIQGIIHEEQPYTFFKSGEGIFIWQNHPVAGEAVEPGRYLRDVAIGLDSFHPLSNRTNWFWHFAR